MESIQISINKTINVLQSKHNEKFLLVYDNYFLSPSGVLYSYFYDRLRFIKPSYKISRDGRARPTLRLSVNKRRLIFLQYRLTAEFFSGEDIEGKQINHLNDDVYDVHPDNLDVGDALNNCSHKIFKNELYKVIDQNLDSRTG